MDSIISALLLLLALQFLAAIGPGIGQGNAVVRYCSSTQQKAENLWYIIIKFSVHGSVNYLWFSCCFSTIIC
jgi:F0F1-type ATP synthase membrane subunit c/vacuolar-type H+-ATPase subunit K